MEREIEVSKIVVKMGEKEIELSPAEAKKLQELLNGILKENKEPIWPPVDPYPCPYPYPYFPVTYTTGPTDDTTTIIYSI